MKSIAITFRSNALTIPINYQHGVQSMLYSALQAAGGRGEEWHDGGFYYGLRRYKLFTFSSLRGKKIIANGKITFESLIYLDVRGVQGDFCDALLEALEKNPKLTLLGAPLSVLAVQCSTPQIQTGTVNIKMLSPVTVHKTENEKTHYYTPLDTDFSEQVCENFRRKYTAFTGQEPADSIVLTPQRVGVKDKYVTTFKGTYITGWRGEYSLSGRPEYLTFLYYCGLGARNSDGFGMFEIL
ncbi:CRISPR-associated endoribonuclease Cas6 [Ruminococcaceae bacterium OttesenSCG-928-A16]|nr:CRISPR-associated endoribonuclease Cas6 [Ruminococcaceae bacterium OttesenSCG-928-A16]